MINGLAFVAGGPFENSIHHLIVGKNAHQIVFKANVVNSCAWISLASRTPAQLIVNAAALTALGTDHQQTAGGHNLFATLTDLFLNSFNFCRLRRVVTQLLGLDGGSHAQVAAQLNIGTTASHAGGNGDRARRARFRNDQRFLCVLTRVQHVVLHLFRFQHFANFFAAFNGLGSYQHRLALFMRLFDPLNDRCHFFGVGTEDHILFVVPNHGHVGRHFDNIQAINLKEFVGFGQGSSRHTSDFFVRSEQILERDCANSWAFRPNRRSFLGFQPLLNTATHAATWHGSTSQGVDQHNFTVGHDVVFAVVKQFMGLQAGLTVVQKRNVFRIVKRCTSRQ